jgi:hypothetical protein
LPRIRRFSEAKNIRRFQFGEYTRQIPPDQGHVLELILAAMKFLLRSVLAPRRVSGLGGLVECQGCGSVGATLATIRHRNCLWATLVQSSSE